MNTGLYVPCSKDSPLTNYLSGHTLLRIFGAICVPSENAHTLFSPCCADAIKPDCPESSHGHSPASADVIAMLVIALFTALMLALRYKTRSWRGVCLHAPIANLGAIAAVLAFELMTTT